jgi:hypothetical protein
MSLFWGPYMSAHASCCVDDSVCLLEAALPTEHYHTGAWTSKLNAGWVLYRSIDWHYTMKRIEYMTPHR